MQGHVEEGGLLVVPLEVLEQLGWQPGTELHVQAAGGQLLIQPATAETSFKDDARRLAAAMRGLTRDAVRHVSSALGSTDPDPSAPPSAPTVPAPPVRPVLVGPAPDGTPAGAQLTPFHGVLPIVGPGAYLAPGSHAIGDVRLGEECSLWAGAVVRGDVAPVRIGPRTNIQEGAIVHVSPHIPCTIGARCTIGHQATVHACVLGDDVLVGIHAVVLDGAKVGRNCILAAGTVVPPGMDIPEGKMVMGVPAKVVRDLTAEELQRVHWNADSYVALGKQYLDPAPLLREQPGAEPAPPPPVRGQLPRHTCRRADGPINIDGSLDDPGWLGQTALSALVLATDGSVPRQSTEVKCCWDDQHLYVAFACRDRDIWGNFENRDDPIYDEEVVEVFLAPTGDVRHYFEIEVSPNNVIFDARVFNPEGDRKMMLVEREWNAEGLRTAVRVSGTINDRESPDIGWIAEMAIPFVDLGLTAPPAVGTVWRANFYRIERGETAEFSAWSPTYRDPADFHAPAAFGEIVFA